MTPGSPFEDPEDVTSACGERPTDMQVPPSVDTHRVLALAGLLGACFFLVILRWDEQAEEAKFVQSST
jgi:hypothetical protein